MQRTKEKGLLRFVIPILEQGDARCYVTGEVTEELVAAKQEIVFLCRNWLCLFSLLHKHLEVTGELTAKKSSKVHTTLIILLWWNQFWTISIEMLQLPSWFGKIFMNKPDLKGWLVNFQNNNFIRKTRWKHALSCK